MSDQRPVCAAADLIGDGHRIGARFYQVVDPDGRIFDLCSACCLIEYATLGALPVDIDAYQQPRRVPA